MSWYFGKETALLFNDLCRDLITTRFTFGLSQFVLSFLDFLISKNQELFKAIELIKPTQRGGDLDQKLLRKEAELIFRRKSQKPDGLNDSLSYTCFI